MGRSGTRGVGKKHACISCCKQRVREQGRNAGWNLLSKHIKDDFNRIEASVHIITQPQHAAFERRNPVRPKQSLPHEKVLEVAVNITENTNILGNCQYSRFFSEQLLCPMDDCPDGDDGQGLGRRVQIGEKRRIFIDGEGAQVIQYFLCVQQVGVSMIMTDGMLGRGCRRLIYEPGLDGRRRRLDQKRAAEHVIDTFCGGAQGDLSAPLSDKNSVLERVLKTMLSWAEAPPSTMR